LSHAVGDPLARLEAGVEADPGAPSFPALAEAYRRAGRYADAERVLREGLERKPGSLAGTAVLALVLLDRGRAADAREELSRVAADLLAGERIALRPTPRVPPPAPATPLEFDDDVSEDEFERAFAGAETDLSQVVDADRVAGEALARAEREPLEDEAPGPGSAFATRTMAELLERQGDARGAQRIRSALPGEPPVPRRPRERVIATLERWLENLRGSRP
jgi:hypothetical protein